MATPDVEMSWPTAGQESLFDTDPFYDRAADPDQPWNMAPGLGHDLASDDAVHAWGLTTPIADEPTGLGSRAS